MLASNLGWMFDGYETFALILTVGVALRSCSSPSQYPQIPAFAGTVIGITLLGWGIGGLIGGVLADYIGRRRTMIFAILAYSLTTGLSAFAWDWVSFALLRFLVGIAIGSEWATGASMTAEVWPDNARGRGAGLMQCGLGIGFFLASFVWLFVSGYGPGAWRIMYFIGVIPALFALWLRTGVPESQKWEQQRKAKIRACEEKKRSHAFGGRPRADALHLRRSVRRSGNPPAHHHRVPDVADDDGGVVGHLHLGAAVHRRRRRQGRPAAADLGELRRHELQHRRHHRLYRPRLPRRRIGRKPVVMVFFAASLIMTPVLYMWTSNVHMLVLMAGINGFFTLGQYSWMPVWLPELFPTRMRATGMAFVFNAPRFIAFLGPLFAGMLIAQFGGFSGMAVAFSFIYILGFVLVPFLPETKGKPLPA